MRFEDIDWNELWKQSRGSRSWRPKKERDWDSRAAGFAKRNAGSAYVKEFLALIDPDPTWTVLDVGSGPGTLAIPLAQQVKKVTALDFSPAMLRHLTDAAAAAEIDNIETVEAAWEDDWAQKGISAHDVTIASRSLSVGDLGAALAKLDRWATKAVFIADKVGSGPFDPTVFEAVGRSFSAGPDYIFTVNILYSMGIYAHVDFITVDRNLTYDSPEQALESCRWMLDCLTREEEEKLSWHVSEHLSPTPDGRWQMSGQKPAQWAMIWWKK